MPVGNVWRLHAVIAAVVVALVVGIMVVVAVSSVDCLKPPTVNVVVRVIKERGDSGGGLGFTVCWL